MLLPRPRGPVSRAVVSALRDGTPPPEVPPLDGDVLLDADRQLALWVLFELSYRGFDDVVGDREWDPDVVRVRRALEADLEAALRRETADVVAATVAQDDLPQALLDLASAGSGPSPAGHLHRHADVETVRDFLRERSLQQLQESDPQAFLLPRLTGRAKTALAELLHDEFGGGRPEWLHQRLYADAMVAVGLDPTYGTYVDQVSALSLAEVNVMSMFGLNRRLRGAAAGHLAAFEASSPVGSRKIAGGMERLGLPPAAAAYFHEHVEADSVHEQVAARDICGAMVEDEPELREDVAFGAAACHHLEALSGADLLARWTTERAVAS